MAERVSARLTPAEGRKFAFTVGLAFVVLAGISYWRGHQLPPKVLGGLGVLLLVAGALVPGHLGPVQRGWMGLAHVLSKVTTPIFLGVVYFVILTPIGLVMRAFGRRALKHPLQNDSYWVPLRSGGRSDLTTQF